MVAYIERGILMCRKKYTVNFYDQFNTVRATEYYDVLSNENDMNIGAEIEKKNYVYALIFDATEKIVYLKHKTFSGIIQG